MQETPQQYIARMLSYVGSSDPISVLRSTPKELERLAGEISDAAADWKPEPKKWSIRQQLAHLADVELILGTRVRFAAAQPGGEIVAFDQDIWAEKTRYSAVPVKDSINTIVAVRRWNLAMLDRLGAEERAGWAMHQERGKETVDHMLKMLAGHDINHLRHIHELLEAQEDGRGEARIA